MKKIKPIKAWAAVVGGKLDAMEIYKDKDIVLMPGEEIVRVEIKVYEQNPKRIHKK